MSVVAALLVSIAWGGAVALDTAAFLQLLFSQPFVAGAVTGAIWGRPALGLELGAILQLFALGTLPVGGRTPDDFPVGAVVGVSVAALLDRMFPVASAQGAPLLFGLLAAFVTALVGKSVISWQRRRNESLARDVEARLAEGRLDALGRAQWAGAAQSFGLGAAWTATSIAVFSVAGSLLLGTQGVTFGRAWQLGAPLLWGFGAGLVTRGLARGRRPGLVFWIALVAFLALRLTGLA